MRLLLINQFYPPDVAPTGQVLADLARTLAARGHDVQVLASRAPYDGSARYPAREERDGVRVRRLPAPRLFRSTAGRVLQQGLFASAVAAALMRGPKPDLVLSLTTPPFLGLWARAIARVRRVRHANWVMDVYPDVLSAQGWVEAGGPASRLLRSLARLELAGASLVLGLGPVQAARIAAHSDRDVPWVPLWSSAAATVTDDAVAHVRAERGWANGDLVFLYSGNLGRGHTFTEFLEAARRLGADGPRWAFCGGGERTAEVAAFLQREPAARVQSLPYVPRERLAETLAAGDVHLVSIRGAWQGLIVPSKVQAAFTAGRPVILVAGHENEAAQWVTESGGGWRAAEGDVSALLAAVEQARDPGERRRRGAAALAYARQHFDAGRNCARIADLLEGTRRAVPPLVSAEARTTA